MTPEEWMTLMTSPEDLHEDLAPWLDEVPSLGKCLRHPLVYAVPFMSNGYANRTYEIKRAQVERAATEENWHTYVFLHERPHRLQAFTQIADSIKNDATFWDTLGGIWTDSENIWQNTDLWEDLLGAERPSREHLMDDDERQALEALPDPITVYRGCCEGVNERGLSWTTSEGTAHWFATRFAQAGGAKPIVLAGTVKKSQVVAHFLGRNESEVVIRWDDGATITKVMQAVRAGRP